MRQRCFRWSCGVVVSAQVASSDARREFQLIRGTLHSHIDYRDGLRILPNSAAPKSETVVADIANTGGLSISLIGWRLCDEAKPEWMLDSPGTLEPGQQEPIVRAGQPMVINKNREPERVRESSGQSGAECRISTRRRRRGRRGKAWRHLRPHSQLRSCLSQEIDRREAGKRQHGNEESSGGN